MDLLSAEDVEPVAKVLSPWLPERGVAMIVGYRGVGKTMFGLLMALCIGAGETVLGFTASCPRKVLYIDGEMDLAEMRQRIADIVTGHPELEKGLKNVHIYSHQDQEHGIPNLVENKKSRRQIEELMEELGCEVAMFDNLSCLTRSAAVDENNSQSWVVMQEWLLVMRRRGWTSVLLHHAGKPDRETKMIRQRGTSAREDILNTTLLLAGSGHGTFTVVADKHRGFEMESFKVKMAGFAEQGVRFERVKDKVSKERLEEVAARLEGELG